MKADIIVGPAHWSMEDQTWGWHEFTEENGYRPKRYQCAATFATVADVKSIRAFAVKRHMAAGLTVQDGAVLRWHVGDSPMLRVQS